MKLVYAGFDTIDIAFQTALRTETLETLRAARDKAAETQERVLTRIGPGNVAVHVEQSGRRGGYAFQLSTGPLGEVWAFKDNTDSGQWNAFASIRASALAAQGYEAATAALWSRLEDFGCKVLKHSLNRVDYAMDFLTGPDFELSLDNFVAHSRTKSRPFWTGAEIEGVYTGKDARDEPASAVFTGRRLSTATIGKMPGRQITVYDKRREAIDQHKPFWFYAWGIDPKDRTQSVWRVEIRLGKDELKDRWQIAAFDDLERGIGDAMLHAVDSTRYLADRQTDSNVSRQDLHPLWQSVRDHVEHGLMKYRSGLTPDQVRQVEREAAKQQYAALVVGNLAGLAVAEGIADDDIEMDMPILITQIENMVLNDNAGRFKESISRARQRLHFIN